MSQIRKPRIISPPYTCPRCGFYSENRSKIVYHLFTKRKVCPGIISRIELTDEVKNDVLVNRIYVCPQSVSPVVINNVQVYNNIGTIANLNNCKIDSILNNMDPVKKITKLINIRDDLNISNFENLVCDKLKKRMLIYENEDAPPFEEIDEKSILDLLQDILKANHVEDVSHFYNPKDNNICVRCVDTFEMVNVDECRRLMLEIIQQSTCIYERCIIQKLENKIETRKHEKFLNGYYYMINMCKLEPDTLQYTYNHIMYNKGDPEYNKTPTRVLSPKYSIFFNGNARFVTEEDQDKLLKALNDIIVCSGKINLEIIHTACKENSRYVDQLEQ